MLEWRNVLNIKEFYGKSPQDSFPDNFRKNFFEGGGAEWKGAQILNSPPTRYRLARPCMHVILFNISYVMVYI